MAKVEQKRQEKRVPKQRDGGAGIGGLLAVGGAIAAAALLGALTKHAAKRNKNKSVGDAPKVRLSEELDCKHKEGNRGLRSLLQTSPPTWPKYQCQVSSPREEESIDVCPMQTAADEFVITENLITEKEPASDAKQDEGTPTTEGRYTVSNSSARDTVFAGNDSGVGDDGALTVVEEFSFPVMNPDVVSLYGTRVVYHNNEDLVSSSSVVLVPPTEGGEVEIGFEMICVDKSLAEKVPIMRPREENEGRKDGIEDIPMESETEGERHEEGPEGTDNSHMVSNVEQEKEDGDYYISMESIIEEEKDEGPQGKDSSPTISNIRQEKEEEASEGAENDLMEPKDEKEIEQEAYDGAGKHLVEPIEEEAYGRAENYQVEPEKEEAYPGAGNYLVEPMEEKEEAYAGTGNHLVEPMVEKEEADTGTGIHLVEPIEEKEAAYPGLKNYLEEPIEEEEAYHGAGIYQVEPTDGKESEEETFDGAGNYQKDEEEKEEEASDEAECYPMEPKDEKEKEEEDLDGPGNYLVEPKDEKEREDDSCNGARNYLVVSNDDEEKEEGSEGSGDFSTESNVEEEKDGEGSDGTGDSSMDSNAEVIWPAEMIEGSLLQRSGLNIEGKTPGDVTGEKEGERAKQEDGRCKEEETEDIEEVDGPYRKEQVAQATEEKAMTGKGLDSVTNRGKSSRYLPVSALVGFLLFLLLSHLLAESYHFYEYFTSTPVAKF
ncbi:uncharacterized protein [Aristolochia californica]|uniref:uncharacterized protein n=1 Tax=Aristolochia californica TaxID=171875 RepID=UPI0035D619F3